MTGTRHNPAGLTLAELIVALVVGALLATATTVALSQLLRTRTRAAHRAEAFERAEAAADRIAADLAEAARDADLYYARVYLADRREGDTDLDEILLYTRSMRTVRSDAGEGGEYEVQYRIAPTSDRRTALWRRADPVPDEAADAGGVAAPVVRAVRSLRIEACDGSAWYDEWDSDYDGLPHALRVTVRAESDDADASSWARRTVAIDRTPPPIPVESDEAEEGGEGGMGA